MLPPVGTTPDTSGICDAARKRRLKGISFADFQLASLIFDSRLQRADSTSVKKKGGYGVSGMSLYIQQGNRPLKR